MGGKEANKHESEKFKHGRGAVGKQEVLGLRERDSRNVKAMLIDSPSQNSLHSSVHESIEQGSTIDTDDYWGYDGLGGLFYEHGRVYHSAKDFVNQMAHTNSMENDGALLEGSHDAFLHYMSVKHLGKCVEECAFLLNEGKCQNDIRQRIDSVCSKSVGEWVKYKELVQ